MARPLRFGRQFCEHLHKLASCICGQDGGILNRLEPHACASNRNMADETRENLNLAGTHMAREIGKPEKAEGFAKKRVRRVGNRYLPRAYVSD